jgi:hypothetical protein
LKLVRTLNFSLLVTDEFGCRTKVSVASFSFVLVALFASKVLLWIDKILLRSKPYFFLVQKLLILSVSLALLLLALFKVLSNIFAAVCCGAAWAVTSSASSVAAPWPLLKVFVVFLLISTLGLHLPDEISSVEVYWFVTPTSACSSTTTLRFSLSVCLGCLRPATVFAASASATPIRFRLWVDRHHDFT